MASITKRGDLQWQVKVRRKGYPAQSATFFTRSEAEKWARSVESGMDKGTYVDNSEAQRTTLHEALTRYMREVTPRKKGSYAETKRIERWQKHSMAKCSLVAVRGKDLADFRDARRADGKAENTIRLDIALISALYETARRDWGMEGLANPARMLRLPAGSRKRDRCLTPDEQAAFLAAIPLTMPRTPNAQALFSLALETGMRQSELLGIAWEDIDVNRRFIHLSDTKSGDPRDVPLSPHALKTIQSMPRPIEGGRVFEVTQDRLTRAVPQACQRARTTFAQQTGQSAPSGWLEGEIVFHTMRHTAATRWAPVLAAQELAKMFGWKTMQMALRYYHPTGESLATKLSTAVG